MARDWWRKRSGFDLWSVPHFLFGIITGTLPALIEISFYSALLLTITLAILWEVFEKITSVKESFQNIVLDIILPIFSFTLTSFVLIVYPMHPNDILVVTTAVSAIYIFTNISGWLAYRRRQRDFMN
jgi:fructose-specific phosphotransferase system IIC component